MWWLASAVASSRQDMASLSEDTHVSELALDSQLKCPVCSEHYREPKLLPCGHTICLHCIEDLVSTSSANTEVLRESVAPTSDVTLSCPECACEHSLPSEGARSFPADYSAVQAIDAATWHICMQQNSSSCGVCETVGQVEAFCSVCASFLCSQCTSAHKRMRTFADHNLSPPHVSTLTIPPTHRTIFCTQHPTVAVNMYCVTCEQLICNECLCRPARLSVTPGQDSPVHLSHMINPITEESLSLLQDRIAQLTAQARLLLHTLKHDLQGLENQEEKVKVHPDKLRKAVNETVDSWIAAIENTRQKALRQIDESCTESIKFCQEQKLAVSERIKRVESSLRFTSKAIRCDGTSMRFVMLSRSWSLLESPIKDCRTVATPTTCNFYQVKTPRRESASLDLLVTRVQSLTISKITRVELGRTSSLEVSFRHKPIESPVFRVAFLGRSKRFADLTNCSRRDECVWEVEFTPRCIGRYHIEAQVYGQWISSQPFSTSPLSQLQVGDMVTLSPDTPFELVFLKPPNVDTGRIERVQYSSSDSGRTINYKFEIMWGQATESSQFYFSFLRNSYHPFPLELAVDPPNSVS